MEIRKSQVSNELLPSAIAWEQLRHSYWSRPGWDDIAADCEGRISFYQSRLNDLLSEHVSND